MKLRRRLLPIFLPFVLHADESWSGVSDVRFKGYSTLHDFEGTIERVPLQATVTPGKEGRVVSATSEVPVKRMSTRHEERDQNMMKMFQEATFRVIKVEVNRATERDLRPHGTKPGSMPVALTIAGTRGVVTGSVVNLSESDKEVSFDLKFPVSLKAFKLKPPSALIGLVRVKDNVDVTAHVALRKEGAQ